MCVPACCFMFFFKCLVHIIVCIYNHRSMCHVHVCAYVYVFFFFTCHPNGSDGVSLSVWGKSSPSGCDWQFFFYTGTWNGLITLRMKNNPSLYLTSISTSKPQIAPIKALVWHAHTNTQLFDLISLVSMSGRRVFLFHIGLNGHLFVLIHQGSQHKCICMSMIHVLVSTLFVCFDKGNSLIAVNVSC